MRKKQATKKKQDMERMELDRQRMQTELLKSKPWLNVKEAALYLGISKETIYRLITSRTLKPRRAGKLYRFNQKTLDNYLTKT